MKITTKWIQTVCLFFLIASWKIGLAQCTPTISFVAGGSGNVSFFATTPTNSVGANSFYWSFGNGATATGTMLTQTATTYTTNGIYTVTLTYVNSATSCIGTISQTLSISNAGACNLTAGIQAVQNSNNGDMYSFSSSPSSGLVAGSSFTWIYGDGSPNGSGSSTSHQYATGTYTVKLIVNNNFSPACIDTAATVISACAISGTLSLTTSTTGLTNFMIANSNVSASTSFLWNFGDGVTAVTSGVAGITTSHTYTVAAGTSYTASVVITNPACSFTLSQSLTPLPNPGPCTASSNFSIAPTGTPQVWYAAPFNFAGIVAATWNWGDGSTSNTLFTSHTYSAAGMYTICLTATLTCNGISTSCNSYSVYRSSNDMNIVQIIVLDPSTFTGLNKAGIESLGYTISPNPNKGSFQIFIDKSPTEAVKITVYNLVGQTVYETESHAATGTIINRDVNLDLPEGIYLVRVKAGAASLDKKLIINK